MLEVINSVIPYCVAIFWASVALMVIVYFLREIYLCLFGGD